MSILIFVVILLVLVLVHEFGHFFTAKKFGIRVDEFGFGFPPKLFGIKKGETEYTFNLLPIGGFVKIFGEDPNNENSFGPDRERSFVHKAKWKQATVLFAGVFANFLLAWFLFSVGFMSGLKSGDKIVSIQNDKNYTPYINPEVVKSFIASSKGKEISVGYVRENENKKIVKLIPEISGGEPKIGVSMDEVGVAKLPFFRAFLEGMSLTIYIVKGTVLGLYTLILEGIKGQGSFTSITGPVGMVGIVGDAYKFGFVYLMSFAALISINLGVINLLPFPALDGGRLFFLLIEKIKGSSINPKVANTANAVGFGILILLMLVVTYHDVVKLF